MLHLSVAVEEENKARYIGILHLTDSKIQGCIKNPTYSPWLNHNYNSRYCTKQKKKTNNNKYIYTSRKFPIIVFPVNSFYSTLNSQTNAHLQQYNNIQSWFEK